MLLQKSIYYIKWSLKLEDIKFWLKYLFLDTCHNSISSRALDTTSYGDASSDDVAASIHDDATSPYDDAGTALANDGSTNDDATAATNDDATIGHDAVTAKHDAKTNESLRWNSWLAEHVCAASFWASDDTTPR
jgi:hypothetical protein